MAKEDLLGAKKEGKYGTMSQLKGNWVPKLDSSRQKRSIEKRPADVKTARAC
ncbi:MAG: hypothetical protein J5795_07850 [Lachnospiraceae bacterium]|nr:hypothetical protein [Lachnospiraceae bacterium]